MEDKGLTDGAPVGVAGRREEVEGEDEGEAEQDGDGGEHGGDEEHHDARAGQAHQARVPREVFEARPNVPYHKHMLLFINTKYHNSLFFQITYILD